MSIVSGVCNDVSLSCSYWSWVAPGLITCLCWWSGPVQLASFSFSTFAAASTSIIRFILSAFPSAAVLKTNLALRWHWSAIVSWTPPSDSDAHIQRAWDSPHITTISLSCYWMVLYPGKVCLFAVSKGLHGFMPCLCYQWGSKWMMILLELLLVCAWVYHWLISTHCCHCESPVGVDGSHAWSPLQMKWGQILSSCGS